MKIKTLSFAIITASTLTITGCGGGSSDGGSTSTTDGSSTSTTTTYEGAATAGDLAKFSISGNSLNYEIVAGRYFNGKSGNLTLTPLVGKFYSGSNNSGAEIGLFASQGLGVAVLPEPATINGATTYPIVVGLTNASTDETNMGGDYIYADYDSTSNETTYKKITLTVDPNGSNSFVVYDIDATNGVNTTPSASGCWEVSSNGAYINALVGVTDCTGIDETSTASNYFRAIIRPGTHRKLFVVDKADGTGFGIGAEQTQLTAPSTSFTMKSFWIEGLDITNPNLSYGNDYGFSSNKIEAAPTGSSADGIVYTTNYTNNNGVYSLPTSPNYTYDLYINTYCEYNGSSVVKATVNGMACIQEQTHPLQTYNVFYDSQEPFFIAAPPKNATWHEFNIGG